MKSLLRKIADFPWAARNGRKRKDRDQLSIMHTEYAEVLLKIKGDQNNLHNAIALLYARDAAFAELLLSAMEKGQAMAENESMAEQFYREITSGLYEK